MTSKRMLAVAAAALLTGPAADAQVRITEVYGGGGNSGAPLNRDFVELFNAGTASVNIDSLSLQYASNTGSFNTVVDLPNTSIEPGKFYVVGFGTNDATVGGTLTPDFQGSTTNLAAANGKVALVTGTAALASSPTGDVFTALPQADRDRIVDFVGYGTANQFETARGPAGTNTTSVQRLTDAGGVQRDTNNNATDFGVGAPTPGSVNPVPEPATVTAVAAAGLGLAGAARRRLRKTAPAAA